MEDLETPIRLQQAKGAFYFLADRIRIDGDRGQASQLGEQSFGSQPAPG